MTDRLIVLPDDTAKPLIDALDGARRSVNIRMFLFTDPDMVVAVKAAEQRGVKVRVMLNPQRRDGSAENEETRKALADSGVEVRDSSPAFALTHQKSMVIDGETGYVESLNWETRDLTQTRDYAVVTTDALEVSEMLRCFDADWTQTEFKPDPKSRLIWCPNNGRARIAAFIDSAQHTLWLQNERYQDTVIIERLVRALARGVKVHIMARPPHNLKKRQADRRRRRLAHHARRRRQGAPAQAPQAARQDAASPTRRAPSSARSTWRRAASTNAANWPSRPTRPRSSSGCAPSRSRDWENSETLDLSDEGVLADLNKHHQGGAKQLALKSGGKKK